MTERNEAPEAGRMSEGRNLEFKEQVSGTYLKTVSAFANYGGGRILFGYDDDGNAKGLEDPRQACLDIENRINDSISPQPDYSLEVDEDSKTVELSVREGTAKPYLYKSKAYRRHDSSTIEVDGIEFTRLVLAGKRMNFEDLPCGDSGLSFSELERSLRERAGIEKVGADVLKTLSLYSDKEGFNNAAALLSDSNNFPGIDMAKFGESISIIRRRATFERKSVLAEFADALSFFRDFYTYEEVSGSRRKLVEIIPEAAFREALANAIIHRAWDVDAQIRVLMFDGKIEIASPGGLPEGISGEDYMNGRLSVLRNPILANVFYRLKIAEIFGTGIPRILESYAESLRKPEFEFSGNSIRVTLPLFVRNLSLSADEQKVYNLLSRTRPKGISEITGRSDFGKSKTTEILKSLSKQGYVSITGNGRGTRYSLR